MIGEQAPLSADAEYLGSALATIEARLWDIGDSINTLAAAVLFASGKVKTWQEACDMTGHITQAEMDSYK